jgi:hypothetical protein
MLPHGTCPTWTWPLFTLFVLANITIGFAFCVIPFLLLRSRIRVRNAILLDCFAVFIFVCGLSHFMQVVTLYLPWFWLAAWLEMITGVASLLTAAILKDRAIRLVEIPGSVVMEDVLDVRRRIEKLSYSLEHGITT